MKHKSPFVAAWLNIIPGLGYLYLGRRRVFAILLLVSMVLGIITAFDPAYEAYVENVGPTLWDLLSLISLVAIEVAFIYDAYHEATSMRAESEKKSAGRIKK